MKLCGKKPKLTQEEARLVREWASLGTSVPVVARRFGISARAMREYVKGAHKHYAR